MALIVEDGTGKSDAESFCSVAFADTYHSNRGNAAWAAIATEAEQEQALRKGTEWMEAKLRDRWPGRRTKEDQRLAWPRSYARDHDGHPFDTDEVPGAVQEACAEAALIASGEDMLADEERSDHATRIKVGPIEEEVSAGTPVAKRYPKVTGRVSGLLASGSSLVLA